MRISEKLTDLRRRKGWSQEQLAARLGVTRQSVSKWEGGAATPELEKLIALADLYGVSLDYLAREDWTEDPAGRARGEDRAEDPDRAHWAEQVEDLSRYVRGYVYDSPIRLWGLPLVSIRLSRHTLGRGSVAKGIIAIGNVAIGVVALGCFSVGILSVGAFAVGALAVAAMSFGLVSWGALAVGLFTFGSCAIGIYSCGVAVIGNKIAVGVTAMGGTAIGEQAFGDHVLLWGSGLTREQVEAFLQMYHPNLWRPLLRFFGFAGSVIR